MGGDDDDGGGGDGDDDGDGDGGGDGGDGDDGNNNCRLMSSTLTCTRLHLLRQTPLQSTGTINKQSLKRIQCNYNNKSASRLRLKSPSLEFTGSSKR